MRGYYKKRIDELRAPSLTKNAPPSMARAMGTVDDLADRASKMLGARAKAAGAKKTAQAANNHRMGELKARIDRERARKAAGGETSRTSSGPSSSSSTRPQLGPKAEGPSRTQSKSEEPTLRQARPEDPPKQDPARPKRKVSPEAESSLRRKAKMEGPEGDSARAAMKRMGLEESLRRLGRILSSLL